MIAQTPHGIFIDADDIIYVADHSSNRILIWPKGSTSPIISLTVQLYELTSLFVTTNGDVYFQRGDETGRIDRWMVKSNSSMLVMKFSGDCRGLFIDIHNSVYCSAYLQHKVMKLPLDGSVTVAIEVAGTGTKGPGLAELDVPWGIFVDTNMDLYVADSSNKRIQLFRRGQRNGITVAGNAVPENLELSRPTDVVVDANGYLFIVDSSYHRIIRTGHGELQCLAGCAKSSGSLSNELNTAYAIRLDSVRNLYVADAYNHRIQKFSLSANSCSKFFIIIWSKKPHC